MKILLVGLAKLAIAAIIGAIIGLSMNYTDLGRYGELEESMEERIERYKDFPEKNGSESMFIDTRYTIRSC